MTVEINLTDEPDFVSAERAALLIILKALDKGFEFDIENPLDFSIRELSCQAMNYLIYEAWESEVFAKCLITDIDKKQKSFLQVGRWFRVVSRGICNRILR